MADADKRDPFFTDDHFTFSIFHRRPVFLVLIQGCASGIPDRNRTVVTKRKAEHIGQLPFVLGRQDCHVGDASQIRQVKDPLMSLSIASHQSGPVHCKYHRQILKRHIMDDLIIPSLQEGRIHCKYRF